MLPRLATGATGDRRLMDNRSHAEIGVFLGVDVGKGVPIMRLLSIGSANGCWTVRCPMMSPSCVA